ncbi:MAG: 16S rRNA methyltransferase [Fervidicoccaceae archaeon]
MEKLKYGIILLESSLETLPEDIAKTRKARALSMRYGIPPRYLLLDVSNFYKEMKIFHISSRRGRPDIVHQFLLATQYSPLNFFGKLKVYIHTWKGEIIEVNEKARIPKNYFQFVGLIQQVYMKGAVPSREAPLLKLIREVNLREYLSNLGIKNIVLLHEKGERISKETLKDFTFPNFIFGIGGFPHGEFTEDILSMSSKRISFFGGMQLDAWLAADRLICYLENCS